MTFAHEFNVSSFMWAPNAYTGGTTIEPTPYWPGASEVDMVGVDGYPDTQYGHQFGTFAGHQLGGEVGDMEILFFRHHGKRNPAP